VAATVVSKGSIGPSVRTLLRSSAQVSDRRFVLLVVVAVALARTMYFAGPLAADEGGYLLVAGQWHAGGPHLYGHYFVDRPPLLIGFYRLAVVTGIDRLPRLIATVLACVFVMSAAWATHQLVGSRGAKWAAVTAGAFVVTPLVMAQEANGEILALPFVMLSVALTLAAVRRVSFPLAVAAGLCAGTAVMVKQNFGDAVVFASVFLVASVWQRRLAWREGLRIAAGGVVGGAVVLLGTAAFVVWSRVGFATAYQDVFGFRSTALDVIEDHSLHAPMMRALRLTGAAVVTGMVPLAVLLLLDAGRCRFRGPPVAWAVAATLAFESLSIAVGGSYWQHYLLQLAPMLALGVGVWAADSVRLRTAAVLIVASAVVSTTYTVDTGSAFGRSGYAVGSWVRRSATAGDTATVLYGNADVQQASGLASPYQQLWSLPMRTFDPHLRRLRHVLVGPRAPTWVVIWGGLDMWHIDPRDRTGLELATHYRRVADLCGHSVYLRDGVQRRFASPPRLCHKREVASPGGSLGPPASSLR
jgi:hypothetical protein